MINYLEYVFIHYPEDYAGILEVYDEDDIVGIIVIEGLYNYELN